MANRSPPSEAPSEAARKRFTGAGKRLTPPPTSAAGARAAAAAGTRRSKNDTIVLAGPTSQGGSFRYETTATAATADRVSANATADRV
mmetsp:Transcript_89953/g.172363  ORF Transcript_89953/g.172363 Transcript_89953/m.172363 type:complete len:88 (+) Transcript_89953:472-735(+)